MWIRSRSPDIAVAALTASIDGRDVGTHVVKTVTRTAFHGLAGPEMRAGFEVFTRNVVATCALLRAHGIQVVGEALEAVVAVRAIEIGMRRGHEAGMIDPEIASLRLRRGLSAEQFEVAMTANAIQSWLRRVRAECQEQEQGRSTALAQQRARPWRAVGLRG